MEVKNSGLSTLLSPAVNQTSQPNSKPNSISPSTLTKTDTLEWLTQSDDKIGGSSLDLSTPSYKSKKVDKMKGFSAGFISGGIASGALFGIATASGLTDIAIISGTQVAKAAAKRHLIGLGLITLGCALAGGVSGTFTSQQTTNIKSGAKTGAIYGAGAGALMFALRARSEPSGGILLVGAASGWVGGAAGARVAQGQGVLEASVKAFIPWMK